MSPPSRWREDPRALPDILPPLRSRYGRGAVSTQRPEPGRWPGRLTVEAIVTVWEASHVADRDCWIPGPASVDGHAGYRRRPPRDRQAPARAAAGGRAI